MRKLLLIFSFCVCSGEIYGDGRIRSINGGLSIARWKVTTDTFTTTDRFAWTQKELNAISAELSKYGHSHSTTTIIPTKTEIGISSCALKGLSYDSFINPTKENMLIEIRKIKSEYDLHNDLDPSGDKAADYKQRYEWLREFYKKLAQ